MSVTVALAVAVYVAVDAELYNQRGGGRSPLLPSLLPLSPSLLLLLSPLLILSPLPLLSSSPSTSPSTPSTPMSLPLSLSPPSSLLPPSCMTGGEERLQSSSSSPSLPCFPCRHCCHCCRPSTIHWMWPCAAAEVVATLGRRGQTQGVSGHRPRPAPVVVMAAPPIVIPVPVIINIARRP